MAISQVDICNAALIKIGQDIPIAAMSESSKAARAFTRVWDRILELVLSEYPWPFTVKTQALALVSEDAPAGWAYRYAYPSDCVTLLAVTDGDSAAAALTGSPWNPDWLNAFMLQRNMRYAFQTAYGEQSQSIVSDLESAFAIYASRVTEVGRFSPKFAEALICRLAWEVAPALAGEVGLRMATQALPNAYIFALSAAKAAASNESLETIEVVAPSIAARG